MSASASATLQALKNAGSAAHRALQGGHSGALVVIGTGRVAAAFASSEAKAVPSAFRVVGMFDLDQTKVGKVCGGEVVRSMNRLPHHLKAFACKTAVLAVPLSLAQKAADLCVRSGIKSIINYTPFSIQVPQDVVVEHVWQAQAPSDPDPAESESGPAIGPASPLAAPLPLPRSEPSHEHALSQPATPGSWWAVDSRFLQDYTVGGVLGKGGGGTVLRVRNRVDGTLYALKAVLLRKFERSAVGAQSEELLREVRTLAAVSSHPNIVRYHQSWLEPLSQSVFDALFPSRSRGRQHGAGHSDAYGIAGRGGSTVRTGGSGALSMAAGAAVLAAGAAITDEEEESADPSVSVSAFSRPLPPNPYHPRPLRSVLDITVPPRASPSDAEPSTPLGPMARPGPQASVPPAFSTLPSLFSLGEMVCSPLSPPDEPEFTRRQRASTNSLSTLCLSEPLPLRLPRAPVSPLARAPSVARPSLHLSSVTAEASDESEDESDSGSDGEADESEEDTDSDFVTAGMVRRGAVALSDVEVLFIQMELCAPRTLADWLQSPDRTGSADARTRLRMFRGVLRGVRHIHSMGFVHRDLKPGNIFLKDSGATQIGDFGLSIAHSASPDPPASPSAHRPATEGVGTAAYASPEQLSGSCDPGALPKSDMFSLGLILLELLCAPFSTMMERAQTMQQARAGSLPPALCATHPELAALVRALTERDPSKRPSADEVLKMPPFRHLESAKCERLRARLREQAERIRSLEERLAKQEAAQNTSS